MTAPTDRWSELDRPQRRLTEGEVRRLGEAARWAPSIHNSQPWHLRRLPDGLAVEEDPARAVPVSPPAGPRGHCQAAPLPS